MGRNYTEVYMHFVWATKNREPWLTERIRKDVHAVIFEKCKQLECLPIAVGGMEDHVHLLSELRPSLSISELMKEVKGVSSHLINHVLNPDDVFRWQARFGVFSLTRKGVPRVKDYVLNQRKHHEEGPLYKDLERVT
ncbi:MAG: IS200/IS605 family transposase [Candidatus Omnitrophica bacterium]|nr:IS200/IS605 family transposase [Candidatus Omnitrophota bacterium]